MLPINHVTILGDHKLACFTHQTNSAILLFHFLCLSLHSQFRTNIVVPFVEFKNVLLVNINGLTAIATDTPQELEVVTIIPGLIVPDQINEITYQINRFGCYFFMLFDSSGHMTWILTLE